MSIKETSDYRITDTTRFLLRGLSLYKKELDQYGFINAYLDDADHEHHYENSVYLLFRPKDLSTFEWFVEGEKARTHLFLEEYDYQGGYIVLVYKFPAEYMREYRLFLKGKYSQFDEEYKKLFPMEREGKTEKGVPYKEATFYSHIYNRSKKMREFWEKRLDVVLDDDAEFWDIPNRERETLHIKDIYATGH